MILTIYPGFNAGEVFIATNGASEADERFVTEKKIVTTTLEKLHTTMEELTNYATEELGESCSFEVDIHD